MTKKEYNNNIENKREYLIEYYNKKIEEEKFILDFLNNEKNYNIKDLMSSNLKSNISFSDLNTDISDKNDNQIEESKGDEDEINKMLDKKMEDYKKNQIKRYIDDKIENNNYFPYEQKKLRRDDTEKENRKIYNILKELTDLNEKLEIYKKENKEKEIEIKINQKDDVSDAEIEEEEN